MISRKKMIAAGAVTLGVAALALTACGTTKTVTTPGPTVTQTQQVPGPTATQTQTVSPPPPAAGTKIATFTGSGNTNTQSFNVPSSGDYVVQWTYSGNTTGTGGDNFIINTTGNGGFSGNLPNDIAVSGHGSTEITGDSGTESFNVQSDGNCSWTITVVSAS